MLFRYVLFNTLSVLVVVLSEYFFHIFEFIWAGDVTHISLIILGLYAVLTVCIPIILYLFHDMREQYEWINRIRFIAMRFTSIGLIGTIVGMMMLLMSVAHVESSDLKGVFSALVAGMSTVLLTTLAGILSSVLMDFQLKFVFDVED